MEKYVKISSVNQKADTPKELVQLAEDNYSAYINEAAQRVINCEKPIVLLSGPSGSGKTSAALRLERRLTELGIPAKTLSMDNYFLPINEENKKDLPRDEDGNIDLESPLRLDIPLFSEHLEKLAIREEFDMPKFDFATQSRCGHTKVTRHMGEVIIIEGIHALNPMVTGDTHKFALCMYVSVRTRLKSENGQLLHPRQIRLMRRLCRDRLFRKREYADIFSMFRSVSRGEDNFITPFKNRADYDIDTFMAYEPSVYRFFLLKSLSEEAEKLVKYPSCHEILEFLTELEEIDPAYVPPMSMIREFIGGSELSY